MKKKEIEYIAKELSRKLKEHGFLLTKVCHTGERYVEFELKKENATYLWSVIFKKHGNIDVFLTIYYEAISKLYKQLSKEINNGANFVFSVNMNTYLHPKNEDGYHNTSEYLESPYRAEINDKHNLNDAAQGIYQTYFVSCVPRLITQTETLEKANDLINDIPIKYNANGRPKMLVFSTSFVVQILNGILIAQAINSPKYEEIKNEYLKYSEKFKTGEILAIDLMREAIKKKGYAPNEGNVPNELVE